MVNPASMMTTFCVQFRRIAAASNCLTERLIRNSAIEDYPEKDKFQKIHKKEIRQIQAAFSVIEKTYSVKIPISEIGYIYDILAGI